MSVASPSIIIMTIFLYTNNINYKLLSIEK